MSTRNHITRTNPRVATSAGIPTGYRGVRFRSRLEAKWAHLFDVLRWRWQYEPFDMDGYIPDFILLGDRPTLVEVKPVATYEEAAHIAKCVPLHETYELLVVGLTPLLPAPYDANAAGALTQRPPHVPGALWVSPAAWSDCDQCPVIRLVHDEGAWLSHPSACPHRHKPGCHPKIDQLLMSYWADGSNLTQWEPSS